MSDVVGVELHGPHIAHVVLNRPERKNALSLETFERLPAVAADLARRTGLRAVVLRGEGSDFCSGLDRAVFPTFIEHPDELRDRLLTSVAADGANVFQRAVTCWEELPVPVIAAVDGVCFGGGMQLALAADFRISAPDARFSFMESRWGLIPDMGITRTLPRHLAADRAKELIMTARVLSAHDAQELGLVSAVASDPLAAAMEFAWTLAERSPDAVRAAKRLVDHGWGTSGAEGLRLEARLQAEIVARPNQIEAVRANTEGRSPRFE